MEEKKMEIKNMNKNNTIFPEGYYGNASGLYNQKRTETRKVANSYPIVTQVARKNEIRRNKSYRVYHCKFYINNHSNVKVEFTDEQLVRTQFMRFLPAEVVVEPAYRSKIQGIFAAIIKNQALNLVPIEEPVFEYGWNGQTFAWDNETSDIKRINNSYQIATDIARLMASGNDVVNSLVLAAIHGPMRKVLNSAGVNHGFVTYIQGETAIGKTATAKRICAYNPKQEVVFSFGSDRSELKRKIQSTVDSTLIIDDFNKSSSPRTASRQLQTLAEIIQSMSDSGKLLINENVHCDEASLPHLVVTAESLKGTISFLNRLYLVNMEEALSDSLWRRLENIVCNKTMYSFMKDFMAYISKNFRDISQKIKSDYDVYLQNAQENNYAQCKSSNRINNTEAVQLVLLKMLIEYFRELHIADKLIEKVENKTETCIHECITGLKVEINSQVAKINKLEYLPTLADIVRSGFDGWHDDFLAEDEKEYKKITSKKFFPEKTKVGFCVNDGYISFEGKHMCNLIGEKLAENSEKFECKVSLKALSKELCAYNLVCIDSEGKASCKWSTNDRYYHVNVKNLVRVVDGRELDFNTETMLDDIYKA